MADRTKIWIADHAKELMKTKPVSEIRVKEICEAAEIERSTFYYHFQDKYDLVAWIYVSDAAGMDISSPESAGESLERMRKNNRFYKMAYSDTSQNALWVYIVDYFQTLYEEKIMERLGTDTLNEQLRYSIRMFVYGGVGMSREWFLEDTPRPGSEIAALMFASMPANLQDLLKRE